MVEIKAKSRLAGRLYHEQGITLLLYSHALVMLFLHLYLNTIKEDAKISAPFAVAAPEIDYIMLPQQIQLSDPSKVVLVISYDSDDPSESHVQHLDQNGPQSHLIRC